MNRGVSMEQAVALARAGDAEARYALSSTLHAGGLHEESLHWLRLAADQGHPGARITLAAHLVDGRHCARDLAQARMLLGPLAASEPDAGVLLAELHGYAALGGTDRAAALRCLIGAARLGSAGALRQLGLLAACHRRWHLAHPLLAAAAQQGDACAADALRRPHGAWDEHAAAPSLDLEQLADAVPDLAADIALPPAETLCADPLLRRLPAVWHPLVLDALVHHAAPHVQRSMIVDATTGASRLDPMRTSSHVTLGPRLHDHLVEAFERTIARVAGLPVANGEFLQVLRYRVGEQFVPHVDYFNEGAAGSAQSLADGGQRAQTVLTWLNEGYAGGNTAFPKLRLDLAGRPGDMLHFHNLAADGRGHRDSLHAGRPVAAGEKWLLSQWLRSGSYPPRQAW